MMRGMTQATVSEVEIPDVAEVPAEVVAVDELLREFSTRNTVYSAPMIDQVSKIDPVAADTLKGLVSQAGDDPGVLHSRDALNVLLDLRLALTA